MFPVLVRWAFGTVDVYGFDRPTPLLAGVLMWSGRGSTEEFLVRRVEQGDHDAALAIELGARARSWMEGEE
jgi:hypothetical protein